MAVEIKELVIRAVAVDNEQQPQQATQSTINAELIQIIIERCAAEVLKIMERKESR